jgi:hypothetical protein
MKALLLPLLFVSFVTVQQPSGASGVFPITRSEMKPTPGLQQVMTAWSTQYVGLGPALKVEQVEIHGDNNANSMYNVVLRYSSALCSGAGAVLQLNGVLIGLKGSSTGTPGCKYSFALTRDQTTRAEAFFKVKRIDRLEIGKDLRATFSVSPKLRLVLRIENPSHAPTVQWQEGGSQPDQRNNQFSMRITRNGKPLPEINVPDMGGLFGVQTLKQGETVELSTPIAGWGDVSVPGRYVVQAVFYTELAPAGAGFPGLGRGDRWDRSFRGTVSFEVR